MAPKPASWYSPAARETAISGFRPSRAAIGDELSAVSRAPTGAVELPAYCQDCQGGLYPPQSCHAGGLVGGSIYPGESRLSATYPAAATRPGTEPAQSPVRAAHALAELERSPTVKPTARHDSLLDLRRSRPNDVPSRWEGGSGTLPPCRPWIEAAGLRAVEELAGVFKQVTASGFRTEKVGEPQRRAEREGQSRIKGGGREWFVHYEQWLWACRVDAIVGGGDVVPVLPAVPAAEAQAELAQEARARGRDAGSGAPGVRAARRRVRTAQPARGGGARARRRFGVGDVPTGEARGLDEDESGQAALAPRAARLRRYRGRVQLRPPREAARTARRRRRRPR